MRCISSYDKGTYFIYKGENTMYKLITCDLDETLLNDEHNISKENLQAIKAASKLGVKFVPTTGRGYNSVRNTLEKLGLADQEQEYVISYNGGAITENKGERLLHFDGISFELAQKLYCRGLQYNVNIHVYTKDMVYIYSFWSNDISDLSKRMPVTEIFDKNLDFLKGQDIVKLLYVNTDYSYLKQIESELKDLTKELDISYSSNRFMEFNHKGVNKGAGLLSLANLLEIPLEETIAIGDNFNDLSMIRAAGIGVGVQNMVEEIKPICDYITKATNNESAVAEVIQKFIFGEKAI